METGMNNEVRDTSGKFAPKSERPRKIRSVNLTDEVWQWLAAVAEKAGMSRNDYLEALAFGSSPLMETARPQRQPFIEMVKTETKTDAANITQQPDIELSPLMETVQIEVKSPSDEVEAVRLENQRLHIELGNFASEKESLKQELAEARSQLETERASRKQIEAQLSELKKNSALAATLSEKLTLDVATILSQLRAKRKKSLVSLADIEAILEIIEKS
jgi:DNA repair exonuclease SbcCD ATPase subunit